MRLPAYLLLALLAWLPACTPPEHTDGRHTRLEISLPTPGIEVGLRAEVRDRAHVLAHLSFTNQTPDEFWLYKPLTGEGPVWEEIFYVLHDNPERHSLLYQGPHAEQYLMKPVGLIFVKPALEAGNFFKLAPGATHEVTKNLSEVFDFPQHPGKYLLSYGGLMPAMRDGKQRSEVDPADSIFPNPPLKPVYYDVDSGDLDDIEHYHKHFTVD